MTVKVTLPPTHQPYLERGLLPADFYAYEQLLSEAEREKIHRIRDFFRTQVAPIVDDYWARAEFPHQLINGFATLGLLDWADPDSSEPAPSNLLNGNGACRSVAVSVLRCAHGAGFGLHPVIWLRGAAASVAAGDEPIREDRRVRVDRAARRLRRCGRDGDHRAPRRRRVGDQRGQALDR